MKRLNLQYHYLLSSFASKFDLRRSSEYGAMPGWNVGQVTDMSSAFKGRAGAV